jgi:hypothetical protein
MAQPTAGPSNDSGHGGAQTQQHIVSIVPSDPSQPTAGPSNDSERGASRPQQHNESGPIVADTSDLEDDAGSAPASTRGRRGRGSSKLANVQGQTRRSNRKK